MLPFASACFLAVSFAQSKDEIDDTQRKAYVGAAISRVDDDFDIAKLLNRACTPIGYSVFPIGDGVLKRDRADGIESPWDIGDFLNVAIEELEASNDFEPFCRPFIFLDDNASGILQFGNPIRIPPRSHSSWPTIIHKDSLYDLEIVPHIHSDDEITLAVRKRNPVPSNHVTANGIPAFHPSTPFTNISMNSGDVISLSFFGKEGNRFAIVLQPVIIIPVEPLTDEEIRENSERIVNGLKIWSEEDFHPQRRSAFHEDADQDGTPNGIEYIWDFTYLEPRP